MMSPLCSVCFVLGLLICNPSVHAFSLFRFLPLVSFHTLCLRLLASLHLGQMAGSQNLDWSAQFIQVAQESSDFLSFTPGYCRLAITSPLVSYLKSVWPWFKAQPDPEPGLPPSTVKNLQEPPAYVEGPPAAMSNPEPGDKWTALTIALEVQPRASLTRSVSPLHQPPREREPRLMDVSEEETISTQAHPTSSSCLG